MLAEVERGDIQGLLASGYDHLDHARFIFLKIVDPHNARRWLKGIVDLVTTARHPEKNKAGACLNIAFTWKGFAELDVAKILTVPFSHEFVGGMSRPEATRILGDTGASSQDNWEFGGRKTEGTHPLHILVLLYGKTKHDLDAFEAKCGLNPVMAGIEPVWRQDSHRDPDDRTEPFGFRDGISQPNVMGLMGRSPRAGGLVKAGEFVLGYRDQIGNITRIPSICNWCDPAGYLAPHPDNPNEQRAFGLNGSYLVFRKLSQDVEGFWKFAASKSGGDLGRRELIAAKLVGRWRSGAPLALWPDTPGTGHSNDFDYMSTDPDGIACPIGSHIRRANPRDSLPVGRVKSLEISSHHRIVRRGRKYQEWSDSNNAKPLDEGIYFIALNADLLRQFEFIQQTWLNNQEFSGLNNDKDPIVGDNDGTLQFTIQATPANCHLAQLPRFVTVKGGGYFFLPGIRALRFMANYNSAAIHAYTAQAPEQQPGE